jgi:hypothetical protein
MMSYNSVFEILKYDVPFGRRDAFGAFSTGMGIFRFFFQNKLLKNHMNENMKEFSNYLSNRRSY